jgi:hypothetical protein
MTTVMISSSLNELTWRETTLLLLLLLSFFHSFLPISFVGFLVIIIGFRCGQYGPATLSDKTPAHQAQCDTFK